MSGAFREKEKEKKNNGQIFYAAQQQSHKIILFNLKFVHTHLHVSSQLEKQYT